MARPSIVTSAPGEGSQRQRLARKFRALGNAWRLQILDVIIELESATEAEIIARTGVNESRAPLHLYTLLWSGLIAAEDDGDTVHYSVTDDHARQFLQLIQDFSAARPRDEESEPTTGPSNEDDQRPTAGGGRPE